MLQSHFNPEISVNEHYSLPFLLIRPSLAPQDGSFPCRDSGIQFIMPCGPVTSAHVSRQPQQDKRKLEGWTGSFHYFSLQLTHLTFFHDPLAIIGHWLTARLLGSTVTIMCTTMRFFLFLKCCLNTSSPTKLPYALFTIQPKHPVLFEGGNLGRGASHTFLGAPGGHGAPL